MKPALLLTYIQRIPLRVSLYFVNGCLRFKEESKRNVLGRRNSCAKLTFKTANSCFYESVALTQDGRSPNFYHLQPLGN